jgi:dUTP pyrophosphatase
MLRALTKPDLLERLTTNPPLVASMVDPKKQVQCNGIDFSLKEIHGFTVPRTKESRAALAGRIDFDNTYRRIADTSLLKFDSNGWVYLTQGCYKAIFNEIVHIPTNVFAIARPRSSLIRNGGTVETGVWDSGYSGRSEALLLVFHKAGVHLRQNARLIQVVFFELSETLESEDAYNGRYQGENLSEQLDLFDLLLEAGAEEDL